MQEKQAINVVNSMTISKRNIVQREFEKHRRENFVSTWLIDAVQKTRKKISMEFPSWPTSSFFF
jgi:hypothetical protein